MTKEKTPDNNKRLAALEAGVSSLAIALAANGVTLAEGGDPIVAAITRLKAIAELEAKVAALEAGPDGATEGEIAAIARAETAEKELAVVKLELEELKADVEDLATDRARLANELTALKENRGHSAAPAAEADAEAAAPEPSPRERPEHARDVGPTFGNLDRKELGELVELGEDFSIAFSNGEYEIVDFAPVELKAAELVAAEGRLMVSPAIFVRAGEYREEVHGAALIHEGEQVAYCEFPAPIVTEPKQERRFERAILFG